MGSSLQAKKGEVRFFGKIERQNASFSEGWNARILAVGRRKTRVLLSAVMHENVGTSSAPPRSRGKRKHNWKGSLAKTRREGRGVIGTSPGDTWILTIKKGSESDHGRMNKRGFLGRPRKRLEAFRKSWLAGAQS